MPSCSVLGRGKEETVKGSRRKSSKGPTQPGLAMDESANHRKTSLARLVRITIMRGEN